MPNRSDRTPHSPLVGHRNGHLKDDICLSHQAFIDRLANRDVALGKQATSEARALAAYGFPPDFWLPFEIVARWKSDSFPLTGTPESIRAWYEEVTHGAAVYVAHFSHLPSATAIPGEQAMLANLDHDLQLLARLLHLRPGSAGTVPASPNPRAVLDQLERNAAQVRNSAAKLAGGPRRRGRKPDYDPAEDQRVSEAWHTRQYKTYESLGLVLGKTREEIKETLDRHRKRPKRPPE